MRKDWRKRKNVWGTKTAKRSFGSTRGRKRRRLRLKLVGRLVTRESQHVK